VRIAVDAMGADAAPRVEVEGVLSAVREADLDVVLVGDERRVRPALALAAPAGVPGNVRVHHAPEVITMHDAPATVVRQKKNSSMRVCFDLAKSRDVDALVSAGNSGAMMACGLFVLGRSAGVERPAIITTFPTKRGQCDLLDMGANVDTRPGVLAQFAVLGSVYARLSHGKARPRVGLLSNGAEEHKGTALTRETHQLLSRARGEAGAPRAEFDYVGYVEGRDIFDGVVDVIVTDGFTGNVLLKGLEGLAEAVFHMVAEEVRSGSPMEKLGAVLMRPALRRFKRKTDYAETGGAPLLGVEGVAVICHGGSDARAIKNAILAARRFARLNLTEELRQAVGNHAFLWQDDDDADDDDDDDDEPAPSGSSAKGLPS
jgi:glycerol-3-phosphate acyltransferase PlsX